jgi:glycerol-3-phosphate acyltransferase PlsY
MNETWTIVIIIIASYLFGSISMTRLVTKIVAPEADIEDTVYEIPGAEPYKLRTISSTTASLKLGSKVGGIIAMLDMLKGFIPVLVLRLVFPENYYHLIAAVFIVVGHDWSIFYRFTGGGGMATTYGSFFGINFLGTLACALGGALIGLVVFRDIVIAFTSGPILILVRTILWAIFFNGDWATVIFAFVLNLIIILKILPDIIKYAKMDDMSGELPNIMDQTGMGRGMKKLMEWMGLDPDKKKKNATK